MSRISFNRNFSGHDKHDWFNVVFVLVGISVAVGVITTVTSSFVDHKDSAEKNLSVYAKEMGYNVAGYSCANKDTDANGYVSCTLRLKEGNILDLECVGAVNPMGNSGCRIPRVTVPNTN